MSALDSNEEQYDHVQLLLHFNSVEKLFWVPGRRIQELLNVYGLLHKLEPPGAVQCTSLQVSHRSNKSVSTACTILEAIQFASMLCCVNWGGGHLACIVPIYTLQMHGAGQWSQAAHEASNG